MKAIFKREFKSYFSSPVGYVAIAALTVLYGFFYFQVMLLGSSAYVSVVFSAVFSYGMMIIPILTMKTMAEDRKNKTDQALLTAPVSVTNIVIGKFLSCFAVYAIATTIGLLPAVAMSTFSSPDWGVILGNYVATLLYGGAMIAIGIYVSNLTVSQVIAAIATFGISLGLVFVDSLASAFTGSLVGVVLNAISFSDRYTVYTQGVFSFTSTVYFLSVIILFVFLTSRKLESRRWN